MKVTLIFLWGDIVSHRRAILYLFSASLNSRYSRKLHLDIKKKEQQAFSDFSKGFWINEYILNASGRLRRNTKGQIK